MQDFHKLQVYQEAFLLSKEIFKVSAEWKHFRLKEQLFGSSTSICANLAEMGAFENKNQQRQKVITCIGEANETEFWLDFCKDNNLITLDQHKNWVNQLKVIRMKLFNLHKAMKEDS
jgi:four helix bundle protein